jgi:peptide/nickel transport system substrate-binding protein
MNRVIRTQLPTEHRFMRKKRFSGWSIQVGMWVMWALGLVGCSPPVDPIAQRILRLNIPTSIHSLDPALANSEAAIWVVSQLYEGLVSLDTALQIQPAIAQRWTLSDSGRTYTFTLNRTVRFAPCGSAGFAGRAVRASDVVYSLTRICSPATASPGLWVFLDKVVGAEAYHAGKAARVEGFEALNDSTVRIQLVRPFPAFLSLLAMPYGYVLPEEAARRLGKQLRTTPLGSGPFRLRHWDEGRRLLLERNPTYHDPHTPWLNGVDIRFLTDRLVAFNEFLAGRIDLLDGLDKSFQYRVIQPDGQLKPSVAGRLRLRTGPQLTTEYLGFRTSDPRSPLANPKVRLALHHAINKRELTRVVRRGLGQAATGGLVPPGTPGFPPDSVVVVSPEYNPRRALELLAAAGYPKGQGLPTFTLLTSPAAVQQAELIQRDWAALGVRLEIEQAEGTVQRERVYNGTADIWRASWMADYPDAENYLSLLASRNLAPHGPNTTRWQNPAYDRLLERATQTLAPDERHRLYHRAESLHLAESPVIPLYYYASVRMVRPYVRHEPMCAMNLVFPLKHIRFIQPQPE